MKPKALYVSLSEELIAEQREFERLFAVGLINDPVHVLEDCGWLPYDIFADDLVRNFWKGVKDHEINSPEDAVKIAIQSGLFFEVNEYDSTGYMFSYREWAAQIVRLGYFRNIVTAFKEVLDAIKNRDDNAVRDIIDKANTMKADDGNTVGITPEELDAEFGAILDNPPAVIKTFLPEYDNMTGGYYPSELTVIASRPGMGKTALLLQEARQIAYSRKKVLLISIEMAREQIWARMACGDAGVEWQKVRSGDIMDHQRVRINEARKMLVKNLGKYLIIDDQSWDVFKIEKSVMVNKPDIVMIDQLPDIRWHVPSESPVEWYGKACWYFRQNIARRKRIPVVLVHQINRDVDDRKDHRPQLSDLRMSGEIEQRADVVIGCYRDDIYNGRLPGITKVPFELITLKNRQGNSGNIAAELSYDLIAQWFS